MPANSISPLSESDGPSIAMKRADHKQTKSWGSGQDAKLHRQRQVELIAQGRFRDALQMDIDDIRSKFGGKYDGAIQQMLEYVDRQGY